MAQMISPEVRRAPIVTTSWMRAEPIQAPPGRHVALAPGVLAFHPAHSVGPWLPTDPEPEPISALNDFRPPSWHSWALCAGGNQEPYFSEDRRARVTLAVEAKKQCHACPVAADCLLWALGNREEFGIWAGTSGRRRQQMLERIDSGEMTIEGTVQTWLASR